MKKLLTFWLFFAVLQANAVNFRITNNGSEDWNGWGYFSVHDEWCSSGSDCVGRGATMTWVSGDLMAGNTIIVDINENAFNYPNDYWTRWLINFSCQGTDQTNYNSTPNIEGSLIPSMPGNSQITIGGELCYTDIWFTVQNRDSCSHTFQCGADGRWAVGGSVGVGGVGVQTITAVDPNNGTPPYEFRVMGDTITLAPGGVGQVHVHCPCALSGTAGVVDTPFLASDLNRNTNGAVVTLGQTNSPGDTWKTPSAGSSSTNPTVVTSLLGTNTVPLYSAPVSLAQSPILWAPGTETNTLMTNINAQIGSALYTLQHDIGQQTIGAIGGAGSNIMGALNGIQGLGGIGTNLANIAGILGGIGNSLSNGVGSGFGGTNLFGGMASNVFVKNFSDATNLSQQTTLVGISNLLASLGDTNGIGTNDFGLTNGMGFNYAILGSDTNGQAAIDAVTAVGSPGSSVLTSAGEVQDSFHDAISQTVPAGEEPDMVLRWKSGQFEFVIDLNPVHKFGWAFAFSHAVVFWAITIFSIQQILTLLYAVIQNMAAAQTGGVPNLSGGKK